MGGGGGSFGERSVRSRGIGVRRCCMESPSTAVQGGGGNFARGEFRGENFAVKKGGEIFPWRNFGVTVPSFTTAAGIVLSEQGQVRLRTRLCLLMP